MKTKVIFLTTLLAMIMLLSSSGVAYADSPLQPQMVGSQWAVYEQVTLPAGFLNFYPAAHATTIPTGVQFSMPDATASSPAYVNYLLDTYTTSLTTGNTITATISIVTSLSTTTFVGNPDGGCPLGTCPGAVRLFIQANLPASNVPNCVGNGYNQNNYWWSNPTSYTFVSGSSGVVTLSVSLNPANWSNLCGQFGTSPPNPYCAPYTSCTVAFDSALASIKDVGLSFGSGSYFSNGLGVDGNTGTATFQLQSYTIS
ncbi:MAG: hypothetical protein ACYCPP_00660 [Nitrososphaerales archaeon]